MHHNHKTPRHKKKIKTLQNHYHTTKQTTKTLITKKKIDIYYTYAKFGLNPCGDPGYGTGCGVSGKPAYAPPAAIFRGFSGFSLKHDLRSTGFVSTTGSDVDILWGFERFCRGVFRLTTCARFRSIATNPLVWNAHTLGSPSSFVLRVGFWKDYSYSADEGVNKSYTIVFCLFKKFFFL